MVVVGNLAYVVSDADDGFQIIDISDPTNPTGLGEITDDSNGAVYLNGPEALAIIGNYALVTSRFDDGVQIIDISSSTNPIGVGSIADGENGAEELEGARGIAVKGNYAYVTGFDDDGVQILDLGGLITPTANIGNLLTNNIETDFCALPKLSPLTL